VKLKKIDKNKYMIPKEGKMNADVVIYINEPLYELLMEENEAITQLYNASCLPGVYKRVLGMPDIHTGFGLPIGGIMAMDAEFGVVSAGAIGMDINCGVRLLRTNIPASEVDKNLLSQILREIEKRVPLGLGKKSRDKRFRKIDLSRIAEFGAKEVVKTYGLGTDEDIENTEENGQIPGGDLAAVSARAVERGDQIGTIGSGNHFIEIGYVSKIFDAGISKYFGLEEKTLTVLIHTGSRGFGHQICSDFSSLMFKVAERSGFDLPSKGLGYVPIKSNEGKQYLEAMAAAANFAFANRQIITNYVRMAFAEVFGCSWDKLGLNLIYDVAHNIAKFETYDSKKLLVHRKGATRALPKGHQQNTKYYMDTGHPAIIPGTMGTASYVVVGTEKAYDTFYSVNHGAGRVLSRNKAKRTISQREFSESMKGIVYFHKAKKILDEAPTAYKDIELVVDTLAEIGITKKIVKLKPLAVLKGED